MANKRWVVTFDVGWAVRAIGLLEAVRVGRPDLKLSSRELLPETAATREKTTTYVSAHIKRTQRGKTPMHH